MFPLQRPLLAIPLGVQIQNDSFERRIFHCGIVLRAHHFARGQEEEE